MIYCKVPLFARKYISERTNSSINRLQLTASLMGYKVYEYKNEIHFQSDNKDHLLSVFITTFEDRIGVQPRLGFKGLNKQLVYYNDDRFFDHLIKYL